MVLVIFSSYRHNFYKLKQNSRLISSAVPADWLTKMTKIYQESIKKSVKACGKLWLLCILALNQLVKPNQSAGFFTCSANQQAERNSQSTNLTSLVKTYSYIIWFYLSWKTICHTGEYKSEHGSLRISKCKLAFNTAQQFNRSHFMFWVLKLN